MKFDEIRLRERDGPAVVFDFRAGERPLAVYVLSPSCIWCERNLENIRVLNRERASTYRFIGITVLPMQPIQDKSMRLGFSVYEEDPSHPILQKLGIVGTPATVVFSRSGVVDRIWRGAYTGQIESSVETFFSLGLPGVN